MNGLISISIALMCCLTLFGCGGGSTPSPQPAVSNLNTSSLKNSVGKANLPSAEYLNETAYVAPLSESSFSSAITSTEVEQSVSVSNASVLEGDSGVVNLRFSISLDKPAEGDIDVHFSVDDETARSEVDYRQVSSVATIASGFVDTWVDIAILSDQIPEPDETLVINLTSVSANASLSATQSKARGTIRNDDLFALNDTGIVFRGAYPRGNSNDCGPYSAPGQDCGHGQDANPDNNLLSDGIAGFNFTKLNPLGIPKVDQIEGFEASPWSCVQDNISGLVWEVKTSDGGLRDKNWLYTSFDEHFLDSDFSDNNIDGGSDGVWAGPPDLGIGQGTDRCYNDQFICTTDQYVIDVNHSALCGYSDWRMPEREELRSIVNYNQISPAIDTDYFFNSLSRLYSTTSPFAGLEDSIWLSNFNYGYDHVTTREHPLSVRLVRGGL